MVKRIRVYRFLALLMILTDSGAAYLGAQEFNGVPLDHPAYEMIAMGVLRGMIYPPPAAKPWPVHTVKAKLQEMMYDPEQLLSEREDDALNRAFESLERTAGFVPLDGRYRAEGDGYTVETGFGWESKFSIEAATRAIAAVNLAKVYVSGDVADFTSWNLSALGEFLSIHRTPEGGISAVFPHTFDKQWDGGVLSLNTPGAYAGWPDDPSFAGAIEGELNAVFLNQSLQLRLGRTRHDWGHGFNGVSLFLNAHARPFLALEATYVPFPLALPWLSVSGINGALERFREDASWPDEAPFSNMLSAARIAVNPVKYVYADMGVAAVLINKPDAAFFADLEIRLPGLFALWGSVFVDRLNAASGDFSNMNGNCFAFQAGISTAVYWLSHSVFSLRYTKVEPYCYAGFISGGESLGYYMPPNSDELLFRFETILLPDIKFHIEFQMIRGGVDYGDGAVGGSSRYDTLTDGRSPKYFLMDGVYQWDNVIKLGGSINLKAVDVPLLVYVETGFVLSSFTINGDAGVGNRGNYEPVSNQEYKPWNSFLFSIGFRLFP